MSIGSRLCGAALALALGCGAARGEIWTGTNGERWEGTLSGVFGATAIIADKQGSRQVAIEALDDASLARVADFLAGRSTSPWKTAGSPLAKALRGRLQRLQGEKLVAFDEGGRPEPEIYLVYFGALWCGPCVRISPKLVTAYQELKAMAGDRLELVFVSSDRDANDQLEYARKVRMPWPLLTFSSVGRVPAVERWAGPGIPCLVALTRDGGVIAHSYRGAEYLGPLHVVHEVTRVLEEDDVASPARKGLHRLAVVQHVRAAAGGNALVKPHYIGLVRQRYQTLEVKDLVATLEIDERGRVTEARFEPALDAVVAYQLEQDAQEWLFLPAVREGMARAQRVKLPLKL